MDTNIETEDKIKTIVVGQDEVVDAVDRIFKIFTMSEAVIRPHFFLTGDSGSGKTFITSILANKYKLKIIKINGAALTKEGTSGNSVSKALAPLLTNDGKPTIVFVDEYDKLFVSGNSNDSHAHETTVGVQNEFLTILEDNQASVFGDYGKYTNVKIANCLFIFAGSFNNEPNINLDRLLELGVKREFIGRVSLVFNTKPLQLEDLIRILNTSKLLDNYCKLFNKNVEDVKKIIIEYLQKYIDFNVIGARMLNSIIHTYFITGKLPENKEEQVVFTKSLSFETKDDSFHDDNIDNPNKLYDDLI